MAFTFMRVNIQRKVVKFTNSFVAMRFDHVPWPFQSDKIIQLLLGILLTTRPSIENPPRYYATYNERKYRHKENKTTM